MPENELPKPIVVKASQEELEQIKYVEWVPVTLGDVRVGDLVRTVPDKIPGGSAYKQVSGRIVGIRSGGVTVQIHDRWVNFWPDQLERMERPE